MRELEGQLVQGSLFLLFADELGEGCLEREVFLADLDS